MEIGQNDAESEVQAFLQWMHQAQCTENRDTTPEGSPRRFVPYSKLVAYLDPRTRLQRLLDTLFLRQDPVERPDAQSIARYYLRTFSILLCIGRGQFITYFQEHESLKDQKLPFLARPTNFPASTTADFFDAFKQKQWEFCVESLKNDMHVYLEKDRILPIIESEKIALGGSAVIYKITVLKEYNELEPSKDTRKEANLKNGVFILKCYRTRDAEKHFTAEKKAFKRLRNGLAPPTNIVGYYGSFVQDNRYYGILEYMDGGTLEKYMQGVDPPGSGEDILALWKNMFGLIRGLTLLHGLREEEENHEPMNYSGWHQDITPQNILVRLIPECSPYESTFKLADLGLSHFKETNSPEEKDVDSYGTRAYGAPETFRSDDSLLQARFVVGRSVDVWSLGCVLSEVVTWVVLGWQGLRDYRQRRQRELGERLGSDAGDLFHDGVRVLNTVQDTHKRLQDGRRTNDHITPNAVALITDMMDNSDRRLNSRQAYQKSMRIIEWADAEIAPIRDQNNGISVASRTLVHKMDTQISVPIIYGPPKPSCDDGYESPTEISEGVRTKESYHSGTQASIMSTSTPPPKAPVLKVQEGLQRRFKRGPLPDSELLTELRGRDHVFIIDNSSSMKEHLPQVKKVMELLMDILKQSDPDGRVDVHFTINSKMIPRVKKSKEISRVLDTSIAAGVSNMEAKLASILHDYFAKFDRPKLTRFLWTSSPKTMTPWGLNLYVLTDGMWQPKNDPSRIIKPLIRRLKERNLPENQVGIQFIRFGHQQKGAALLDYLDADTSSGLDIVDTEPAEGNVWKMLLGAVNHWFDDDINKPMTAASFGELD